MEYVKNSFSIKDLENISGIKAHTLRIWEKRYKLFTPDRSDTNIRSYNSENLQKLLNVVFLYNNGYKISKIASIDSEDVFIKTVQSLKFQSNDVKCIIDDLKLSMFNFDSTHFYKIYSQLTDNKDFRSIFYDIFIPFLDDLGFLWQTNTISPAHEHFISNLIKQKIIANTETILDSKFSKEEVFVLFLPDNEIHELGLMYLNYELISHGFKTIYLGQTVPISSLIDVKKNTKNTILSFVAYLTVEPITENVHSFIEEFDLKIGLKKHKLYLLGRQSVHVDLNRFSNVIVSLSISDFLKNNNL